jgi:hypothetical protein
MRTLALLAVILAVVLGLIVLTQEPGTVPQEERSEPSKPVVEIDAVHQQSNRAPVEPEPDRVSHLVRELRNAIVADNREKILAALGELVQHAAEHPAEFEAIGLSISRDDVVTRKIGHLMELTRESHLEGAEALLDRVSLLLLQAPQSPEMQLVALSALGQASEISPEALQLVSQLCQENSGSNVRYSAIATMSEWMLHLAESMSDPARIASAISTHEFLCDQLIALSRPSGDEEIRAQVIQVLAMRNPQLPDKIRKSILDYLETDPSPQARVLVASAVGNQTEPARAFAFNQLKLAYDHAELDLKRNILFQMVCIGDRQTLDWMAQLPSGESTLSQDAQDYLALLQSGRTDPAEIQEIKASWDAERAAEQTK